MEGYVRVKLKFSYRRLWAVLDRQQLTFYECLDTSTQLPTNVKAIAIVKNAIVNKITDRSVAHGINIKCSNSNSFGNSSISGAVFDCYEPTNCSSWFNALTRAAKLHQEVN